jgi:hypothetical protein
MSMERRKHPRFISHAQAVFEESGDRGNLADISVTGCLVELVPPFALRDRESRALKVYPEKDSGVSPFSLGTRVVWINEVHGVCYAGLFIEESPKGDEFQNYVDYLSYYGQYRRAHID